MLSVFNSTKSCQHCNSTLQQHALTWPHASVAVWCRTLLSYQLPAPSTTPMGPTVLCCRELSVLLVPCSFSQARWGRNFSVVCWASLKTQCCFSRLMSKHASPGHGRHEMSCFPTYLGDMPKILELGQLMLLPLCSEPRMAASTHHPSPRGCSSADILSTVNDTRTRRKAFWDSLPFFELMSRCAT